MTLSEHPVDGQKGSRVAVERMAEAASQWLAALSAEQRAKARIPFSEAEERSRWYYTPGERGGLPLGEMTPVQQQLAHRLVAGGLSAAGYVTVSTLMGLENALDAQERWRSGPYPGRDGPNRRRDPGLYFLSLFGEPGNSAPWGWRLGGHHLALHYTIVDGHMVAATPNFFGADPAETAFVGAGRLRPLAGEEDLARELLQALDGEQRAAAVISPVAPPDIVQSNRARVTEGALPQPIWEIFSAPLPAAVVQRLQTWYAQEITKLGLRQEHLEAVRYTHAPNGLAASRMSDAQQAILEALIHQYVDRLPEEMAAIERGKIAVAPLTAVHFAWAGGRERGEPHYYRLQGPRLLVEYDNTQNDANHIHAVWRDPEGDFGADILAAHYAQAHH